LLGRLVAVVVDVSAVVAPTSAHQQQLYAVRSDLARFQKDSLPILTKTKEEMVAVNLNTRRLRMRYVIFCISSAAILGAVAGDSRYTITLL